VKTLFDPAQRSRIVERIERLTPEHQPKWGSMTTHQVICHLATALRLALASECPGRPRGPLSRPPLNWLVMYLLPWPKGKTKAPPELFDFEPDQWARDITELRDLIDQFGRRSPIDDWPANMAFGRISGRAWGVIQYRHLDHHLSQVGV
jgi:hypothetical protein